MTAKVRVLKINSKGLFETESQMREVRVQEREKEGTMGDRVIYIKS
jgi:hypothetical protein